MFLFLHFLNHNCQQYVPFPSTWPSMLIFFFLFMTIRLRNSYSVQLSWVDFRTLVMADYVQHFSLFFFPFFFPPPHFFLSLIYVIPSPFLMRFVQYFLHVKKLPSVGQPVNCSGFLLPRNCPVTYEPPVVPVFKKAIFNHGSLSSCTWGGLA